jgi:hypothetical protein
MNFLASDSIFRCMPTALPLKVRRLFGAFAYAIDGAELSFGRLKATAARYQAPQPCQQLTDIWMPEMRLSVITDAWAFIDHITRLRKLLPRFDYENGNMPELVQGFLDRTDDARQIRNRLQHLDEDIFGGVFCEEGHPVLGTVSWVDTRNAPIQRRYAVSSGPSIDAGTMMEFSVERTEPGIVTNFRLMASDRIVNLDRLLSEVRDFVRDFEIKVGNSVSDSVRAAASERGVAEEALSASGIADAVFLMAFAPKGPEAFEVIEDSTHGLVEVAPGSYRPN